MLVYKSVEGQSVYDVCLNTYGTLDFLAKLIADNSVDNIDSPFLSGTEWTWDDTLINDLAINRQISQNNIIFATKHI